MIILETDTLLSPVILAMSLWVNVMFNLYSSPYLIPKSLHMEINMRATLAVEVLNDKNST